MGRRRLLRAPSLAIDGHVVDFAALRVLEKREHVRGCFFHRNYCFGFAGVTPSVLYSSRGVTGTMESLRE